MITAKEANKKTLEKQDEILIKEAQDIMPKVEEEINKAILQGNYFIRFDFSKNQLFEDSLIKLGYTAYYENGYNESYYIIRWTF